MHFEIRNHRDWSPGITGTVPAMMRDGMAFLKSMLHHRQNGQNFNSTGILEIPEVVLEELLQNALIHLDILHNAAIRLLVFENRVEIINPGRLYGGLTVEDLILGISRQRNPLMASFAENTTTFRGLGSGIVRALKENILIDFVNEEEANQFRVIVWRTIQKDEEYIQKTIQKDSDGIQKSIQKDSDGMQKSSDSIQKTIQKDTDTIQKTIQKKLVEMSISLTDIQMSVLCFFAINPTASRQDYINSHDGASKGGLISTIGRLQQLQLLKRVGGKKNGYWEVTL